MKPGRLPVGPFRSAITERSREYTVYRKSVDNTTYGSSDDDYSALTDTRTLYLYDETEQVNVVPSGRQTNGDLEGFARESVDIQEYDRVDFGNRRYELETIVPLYEHPDDSKQINELSFRRIDQ